MVPRPLPRGASGRRRPGADKRPGREPSHSRRKLVRRCPRMSVGETLVAQSSHGRQQHRVSRVSYGYRMTHSRWLAVAGVRRQSRGIEVSGRFPLLRIFRVSATDCYETAEMKTHFEFLADRPEGVPQIARWRFEAWGLKCSAKRRFPRPSFLASVSAFHPTPLS